MKFSLLALFAAIYSVEEASAYRVRQHHAHNHQALHQGMSQVTVHSHAKVLNRMKSEIRDIEKLTNDALQNPEVDEATKQLALEKISEAYLPYHGMITGWYDSLYGLTPGGSYGYGYGPFFGYPGAMLYPNYGPWNPDHNIMDMVTQEVNTAHKELGYIRMLEGKLKGKKPGDRGTNELDWEMLGNMKKDLGMDPGYKTATEQREENRAAAAGWDPVNHRPIKPY